MNGPQRGSNNQFSKFQFWVAFALGTLVTLVVIQSFFIFLLYISNGRLESRVKSLEDSMKESRQEIIQLWKRG